MSGNTKPTLNIVVVSGVRPQFIKTAALQHEIRKFNQQSNANIVATYINAGQHYDVQLADDIIDDLGIQFDYTLTYPQRDPFEIMSEMFNHLRITIANLVQIPHYVVVLGDATTTMVAAIVAARLGLPVVHIEAGVRSGNLHALEEIHRRVVSHIATIHLCTSKSSMLNLKAENIVENVFWTGDMAHSFFVELASKEPTGFSDLQSGEYILVTMHKSENFVSDMILTNLVSTLNDYPRQSLFVTHPKTAAKLIKLGLHVGENIRFSESLPYRKMIAALKGCAFVITDSGGLQREAYYLGKRCLIRRDTIGWSAFVDAGINRLVGQDTESLLAGLQWIETKRWSKYEEIDDFVNPEGVNMALMNLVRLASI